MTILEEETEEFTEHVPQKKKKKKKGEEDENNIHPWTRSRQYTQTRRSMLEQQSKWTNKQHRVIHVSLGHVHDRLLQTQLHRQQQTAGARLSILNITSKFNNQYNSVGKASSSYYAQMSTQSGINQGYVSTWIPYFQTSENPFRASLHFSAQRG